MQRLLFVAIAISLSQRAMEERAFAGTSVGDAEEYVGKMIEAFGGETKLKEFKSVVWNATFVGYGQLKAIGARTHNYAQLPNKIRCECFQGGTDRIEILLIRNGHRQWSKLGDGEFQENPADEQLSPISLILWKMGKEKNGKVSFLGEKKEKGRILIGVRFQILDKRKIDLFCDKQTGILFKSESFIDEQPGRPQHLEEVFYRDYKRTDGLMMPRRIETYKGDTMVSSYLITDVSFSREKLKPSLFDPNK